MSTGVMLFNPFTGKPRHPDDIASDPRGVLIWDSEEPLKASPPKREPLTEREIVQVAGKQVAEKIIAGQEITPEDWIAFARAIEAAHGIKEKNT